MHSDNLTATDWVGTRGDKWGSQLSGMEGMLRAVDEPLIRALALDGPRRIADVGCGGGGTALEILRQAPKNSVVHGFDIAPSLVDIARSRVPSGEQSLEFKVADVTHAAPPEVPYERLVSRFGVMFFDDPEAAFSNLARWLAPRGRFAFAVWARPAENPWIALAREVVTEFADMPAPDPEAPGPFRYADVSKLMTLLEQSGFSDITAESWRGELPVGGGLAAAEAATFALASFSTFAEQLAKAGAGAFAAAQKALTARYAQHVVDGVVRLDAHVRIVTGTRV